MLANRVRMGTKSEYELVAGDVIAYQNTDEKYIRETSTDRGYKKIREVKVNKSGTIRVLFNLKSSDSSVSAYGQININGMAIGIERSNTQITYTNFLEDFNVNKGDLVQLGIRSHNTNQFVYNGLFQIMIKETPPTGTFEQIL